jgi:hypothetical protein
MIQIDKKARFKIGQNVEYVLKDKNGNVKPIFQENWLFRFLLERGVVSPLFPKIPFILGFWSNSRLISNLITNAGAAGAASRLNGSGGEAAFTYIATGTGTTAAAVGDTALQTEIIDSGLARANATASRVTTDVTNDTAQLLYSFSVTGTKAVTESGVLNAASAGVLLARQVFSAINVVSGDTLQITWKFDID